MNLIALLSLSIILFLFLITYFTIEAWSDVKFIRRNKRNVKINFSWYYKICLFVIIMLILLSLIIFESLLQSGAINFDDKSSVIKISSWIFWTIFSMVIVFGFVKFYKFKHIRMANIIVEKDDYIIINQNEYNKQDVVVNENYYEVKKIKFIIQDKLKLKWNLKRFIAYLLNLIITVLIFTLLITKSTSPLLMWSTVNIVFVNMIYLIAHHVVSRNKYNLRMVEILIPLNINLIALIFLTITFTMEWDYETILTIFTISYCFNFKLLINNRTNRQIIW